jgi:hypothetical protein
MVAAFCPRFATFERLCQPSPCRGGKRFRRGGFVEALGCCASRYREARCILGNMRDRTLGDDGVPVYQW